jgi:small subunit ribosomal protein S4
MITGPQYKIARRLGAPIFEKTQTQKFVQRSERKSKTKGFSKQKSEYALQLNEKQKARFTYGLTERQFSNYVKEAIARKTAHTTHVIYEFLEGRLDNMVYRLGLASTRRAGRQMVSHGHILVNGKKTNIPSRRMEAGDVVSIREGSKSSALFNKEAGNDKTVPSWIQYDTTKKTATVIAKPEFQSDTMFDLNTVIEYYSRS